MKDRWSQLSMSEKSDLMSLYIRNGISSLEEIKKHYNSFAEGGSIEDGRDNPPDEPPSGGFLRNNYRAKNAQTYQERAAASEKAMIKAWTNMEPIPIREYNTKLKYAGPIQNSFLLFGKDKDRYMLEHGYIKGSEGDYGLVQKAVGDRNLPVYQTQPDEIDRNYLVPIGNVDNTWYGRGSAELIHAGNYPSTIYIDGRILPDKLYTDGWEEPERFYQKAWDLNNYDNPLDWFGYPAVQTTGFSKIEYSQNEKEVRTVNKGTRKRNLERKSPMDFLNEYLKEHNLTREVLNDGTILYTHPEVTVTADRVKATGGHLYQDRSSSNNSPDNTRVSLDPRYQEKEPIKSKSSNEQYKEFAEELKKEQEYLEKDLKRRQKIATAASIAGVGVSKINPIVGALLQVPDMYMDFKYSNYPAAEGGYDALGEFATISDNTKLGDYVERGLKLIPKYGNKISNIYSKFRDYNDFLSYLGAINDGLDLFTDKSLISRVYDGPQPYRSYNYPLNDTTMKQIDLPEVVITAPKITGTIEDFK